MRDFFNEQLVKKIPSNKDTLKKFGLISISIILIIIALSIPFLRFFSPFIVFGIILLDYFLLSFFQIEYEYIYTNGDLDIDVVYNKSRRKRLFSGNVKDFEMIVATSNNSQEHLFNTATCIKDYSSGVQKSNTYMFLTSFKGKKTKIIFEPNEKIVNSMSMTISQRKFIK